jgi:phosphoserine phosphatase
VTTEREHFLVLMAAPGSGALAAAPVRALLHGPVRTLGADAVEMAITGQRAAALELQGIVARQLVGLPVDVGLVSAANRKKRLLIADMDSTIIGQECIDEMADLLGLKPQIAAITERAMNGEIEFEAALKERVGLLAGLETERIAGLLTTRITLNPGARTLLATLTANGVHTALVSGGFTMFTSAIAQRAGFVEHAANVLEVVDGRLTGTVRLPILGRAAKLERLVALTSARGLTPADAIAVGDGANDLAMLEAAGLGVAYRAKPAVAARADVSLLHADLTALLYLQGYADTDFVGT